MIKKTWTLKFSTDVTKKLKKLDKQTQIRILAFFKHRVLEQSDPRLFGKSLTGDLSGFWSYRIGDYRVICDILDNELTIVAVEIGHRREVYKFDPT